MAAIANDRDNLLQAASVRFVMPQWIQDAIATTAATRGVRLTSDALNFRVNINGVATPTSITITARTALASSPVTWAVVAGSATMIGTGNTRTLSAGNMTTNFVTIRASVQSGGQTYTDDITITKVYDGDPGVRGSVNVSYAQASKVWSDASAVAAITAFTGSDRLVAGDVVVQYADGWAETKYWSGSSWIPAAQVIDGNLIVRGTIRAEDIAADGTIEGVSLEAIRDITLKHEVSSYTNQWRFYNNGDGTIRAQLVVTDWLAVHGVNPSVNIATFRSSGSSIGHNQPGAAYSGTNILGPVIGITARDQLTMAAPDATLTCTGEVTITSDHSRLVGRIVGLAGSQEVRADTPLFTVHGGGQNLLSVSSAGMSGAATNVFPRRGQTQSGTITIGANPPETFTLVFN